MYLFYTFYMHIKHIGDNHVIIKPIRVCKEEEEEEEEEKEKAIFRALNRILTSENETNHQE